MMKNIIFTQAAPMGEMMKRAGMNTLMGMGTVFAVLILISVLIYALGFIGRRQNKKQMQLSPAPEKISGPAPDRPLPEADLCDDLELVAVITAAIAASENVPADSLVVRSIQRKTKKKKKKKAE